MYVFMLNDLARKEFATYEELLKFLNFMHPSSVEDVEEWHNNGEEKAFETKCDWDEMVIIKK